MNYEILKERYSEYRIKMKSCKNGSPEKRELKSQLSAFLKEIDDTFGRDVVVQITSKK